MSTSFQSDRPSEAAAPRRPPVRLSLAHERAPGPLQGAWWPRSRDLGVELRFLLGGLPEDLGPALRVAHCRSDWARVPLTVQVDGQAVEVVPSPGGETGTVTVSLRAHDLVLLVVPPGASAATAAKAMARISAPAEQKRDDRGSTPIEFVHEHGVYTGRGAGGRAWRISRELTGWRLEFRDSGDAVATNAGVHQSVESAIAEARR
jgi:hypothetical protein